MAMKKHVEIALDVEVGDEIEVHTANKVITGKLKQINELLIAIDNDTNVLMIPLHNVEVIVCKKHK